MEARDLNDRWLALPHGSHTLVVRPPDAPPRERRIEVSAGRQQVVRFDTTTKPRT